MPSWEANSRSTPQEISRHSCNPKGHYCVHKNLPLDHILSQLNSVILFSHLRLHLLSLMFHLDSPIKFLSAFYISPIGATCPTHFRLLDLITIIIMSGEAQIMNIFIMQCFRILYGQNI
jgi:hypothetical protein